MSILNFDREEMDEVEVSFSKRNFTNERDRVIYAFQNDLNELLNTSPRVRALYEIIKTAPNMGIDLLPIMIAYIVSAEAVISEYQKLVKEKLQ